MKRIFTAAEFDPFHNGHAYLISEIKRRFEGAQTVSAMSGSFVQRGGPAIFDKKIRAAVAAYCGIDLTVQLPFVYAAQNAEAFALGAVKTAVACGCDAICFGAENDDTDMFFEADALLKSEEVVSLMENRAESVPFARARIEALNKISHKNFSFLESPNNILALEYIRAVKKLSADITPVAVKRTPSPDTQSASEIRKLLLNNSAISVGQIKAPCAIYKEVSGKEIYELKRNGIENYATAFKAALITKSREEIEATADIGEGSAARMIKNAALLDESVSAFTAACTAKRLTAARVRRSLINMLINYKKDDLKLFKESSLGYIRVLALGARGGECINDILKENGSQCNMPFNQKSPIKVITRLARETGALNDTDLKAVRFDITADDLYSLPCGELGAELRYTPFVLK